jgi:hypothetical protein
MNESLTILAAIIVVGFLYNWVKDVRPPNDFFQ